MPVMIDEKRLYQLLGERLRKLRENFDVAEGRMTQAQLAAAVGLERTSITNIEKGIQKVSLHVLYGICSALNAKVIDVLPDQTEIAREDSLPPEKTEVEFGGKKYYAPPKALQKITAILESSPFDEAS